MGFMRELAQRQQRIDRDLITQARQKQLWEDQVKQILIDEMNYPLEIQDVLHEHGLVPVNVLRDDTLCPGSAHATPKLKLTRRQCRRMAITSKTCQQRTV